MNERLRQIRKVKKLTQKEFAYSLDISERSIYEMERGGRSITGDTILKLEKIFNINKDWFIDGNGDMFIQSNPPVQETEAERIYNQLPEHLKKLWCDLGETMIASGKDTPFSLEETQL